jgi:ATP-dependent RNA helicase DeaD
MSLNFQELGLSKNVLKGIGQLSFTNPTPIQERVIPLILAGTMDIVGLAQTGTGKTAAFGLPLLEKIRMDENRPQALILCPTRELCIQITSDIETYAKYIKDFSVTAVYGGAPIQNQIRSIKKGTHVIVATPGRLLDLLNRKAVNISKAKFMVLDEADIMLHMGFKDELDAILAMVPKNRQALMFSATMPKGVAKIASRYMRDPIEVTVGRKNSCTSNVSHNYFMVHARDKYQALKRIVDYYPDIYSIIFCRTRISTQQVADQMIRDGYNAESLHGDLSQAQRSYVMDKFKDRSLQILVATDIAARGLDVNDLSHVIHYDLPDDIELYTHRSGRTGRAGKDGISLSIINMKEKFRIRRIEDFIKQKIIQTKIPRGRDICTQQLMHLIDKVKTVEVDSAQISPYMKVIEQKLSGLSRDELLKHFVSLEFNRFLNYYKDRTDLTTDEDYRKKPRYSKAGKPKRGFRRKQRRKDRR